MSPCGEKKARGGQSGPFVASHLIQNAPKPAKFIDQTLISADEITLFRYFSGQSLQKDVHQ
ncbi:hypothetical protein CGT82_07435 [Vibrio cholerae]|nr:hypothetical protein CGT82_07435 [Vibrio cholerae]